MRTDRHVRHVCLCLSLFLLMMLSPGCTRSATLYKRSQFLMGTTVEITVVSHTEEKAETAMTAAFKEIRRLEELMSTYISSSEFSRINDAAGLRPVAVSPETYHVIEKAREIGDLTEGGFNIAVGPAVLLWGVAEKTHIPERRELEAIRPLLDDHNILLEENGQTVFLKKKGMKIDPGGIGKGYAADRAVVVLKERGITSGIVAVAGDLKLFGKRPDGKPWRLGITHPRRKDSSLATLELTDVAVSTSGDYERYVIKDGVRYHHILSPQTLQPARGCQSVTIVAQEGILADALATGVFVQGPEKGMATLRKLHGVDGLIADSEGKVSISPGLKDKVLSLTP